MRNKTQYTRLIYILSVLAGIFYSSWVLGYFFNPEVAMNGTASQLAALAQPSRDLYLYGDIITFGLILIIAWLTHAVVKTGTSRVALGSYVAFGMFSLFASLVSLDCVAALQDCSATYANSRILIHNLMGLAGLLFLLSALLSAAREHGPIGRSLQYFIGLWVVLGSISLVIEMSIPSGVAVAFSQRLFLVMTAAAITLVPIIITRKN